ncbi:MAG: hypothetical protein AB8B51_02795 [Sedimentitalea sp.]
MLAVIGGLVIYVAFATPPDLVWQIFLLVTGIVALWMADKMRRATEYTLELTETELRDNTGHVLAKVSEIQSVDAGFFAFKPSNGFLIKTQQAAERTWRPGLWWRLGRRVGIGGVTAKSQTKFMSDTISAMLAQRDQDSHTT